MEGKKDPLYSDKYKTPISCGGRLSEKVSDRFCFMCVGAFGNVKLGYLKKDKTKKFALKAMKKADIIQSKHVDHIENEKKILELMNHPFIVSAIIILTCIDEILRLPAGRQVHLLRDGATQGWRPLHVP